MRLCKYYKTNYPKTTESPTISGTELKKLRRKYLSLHQLKFHMSRLDTKRSSPTFRPPSTLFPHLLGGCKEDIDKLVLKHDDITETYLAFVENQLKKHARVSIKKIVVEIDLLEATLPLNVVLHASLLAELFHNRKRGSVNKRKPPTTQQTTHQRHTRNPPPPTRKPAILKPPTKPPTVPTSRNTTYPHRSSTTVPVPTTPRSYHTSSTPRMSTAPRTTTIQPLMEIQTRKPTGRSSFNFSSRHTTQKPVSSQNAYRDRPNSVVVKNSDNILCNVLNGFTNKTTQVSPIRHANTPLKT